MEVRIPLVENDKFAMCNAKSRQIEEYVKNKFDLFILVTFKFFKNRRQLFFFYAKMCNEVFQHIPSFQDTLVGYSEPRW